MTSPVFQEPWEAQAFAMAVTLHERGVFSWPEWTAVLAAANGDRLAALERIVAEKGVTDAATLARYADGWDRAAKRTAHGAPIALRPGDVA